jgi:hypothetical protein
MSLASQIGSSVIVAIVLAAIALRFLLRCAPLPGNKGPWRVDLSLGGGQAGLYARAFTAWNSLFALPAPEVVYFTALHDSDGGRLQCGRTYSIAGEDPAARWWSITAYKQNRLIPNPLGRYSFSPTTVTRSADGRWVICLSPHPPARSGENWLPTGGPSGNLGLTLRVYGPGPMPLANPETTPLGASSGGSASGPAKPVEPLVRIDSL